MLKRLKELRKDQSGMTLVEMIVVLLILGILLSISVPPLTGYISRANEQKYVMEAQGVKQSIELYLLEEYAEDGVDMMEFLENLSKEPLDSEDCFLADYLKVNCTEGAKIQNLTLERDGVRVRQMVYLTDKYKIEISDGDVSVTKRR